MDYRIEDVFDHGMKRYYICKFASPRDCSPSLGQIGPFTFKKSAQKCVKMLKVNEKIMLLAHNHDGLTDEDREEIMEILEEAIDRVGE